MAARFLRNRPVSTISGKIIEGIPCVKQIAAMKQRLRQRLRKRGKPVAGELGCKSLQAHIKRISEDHFKKSA